MLDSVRLPAHQGFRMTSDSGSPKHPPSQHPSGLHSERRRSVRWKAYVPVFVYGRMEGDSPSCEEAYSTVVNDRGALLTMTTDVPSGERLLLTNKATQVEQECHVVRAGLRDGLSIQVAVEFTGPTPQFWRLTAGSQPPPRAVLIDSHRKAR
mgnify:CR=1 FL=1